MPESVTVGDVVISQDAQGLPRYDVVGGGETPADHHHDDRYSLLAHNHDGVYAPAIHDHNGVYAPVLHSHAWADLTDPPATATRWPDFDEVGGIGPFTALTDGDRLVYNASTNSWINMATTGGTTTVAWGDVTGKPAEATRWADWTEVTGKPTTFTPSAHTHDWADITGEPATYAPSAHTHPFTEITGTLSSVQFSDNSIALSRLASIATGTVVGRTVAGTGAPSAIAISSLSIGWTQLTGVPATFTPSAHTHPFTEVTGSIADAQVPQSAVTQHQSTLSVGWGQLTGVPATFTPSAHAHSGADITTGTVAAARIATDLRGKGVVQYQAAQPTGDVAGEAWLDTDDARLFIWTGAAWTKVTADQPSLTGYATEAWVTAGFSPLGHTHDDRYFTEAESDARFAAIGHNHAGVYAPVTHTHAWADLTDPPATATRWADWAEVTGKPATFPPSTHTHGVGDLTGLAALTVVGNATNAVAAAATMAAGTDGHVLRRSGTALGFGTLANAAFAVNTIGYDKLTNATGPIVIGRTTATLGSLSAIAVSALSIGWGQLTGVPATFAPSAHTHPASEVTAGTFPVGAFTFQGNVTAAGFLTGVAGSFGSDQGGAIKLGDSTAASSTPYVDFRYGKSLGAQEGFNARIINSGDRVLTVQFLAAGTGTLNVVGNLQQSGTAVSLSGHTHAYSSLTGIPATFAPSAHTHPWADITGEPTTLAGYGITDAFGLGDNNVMTAGGAIHAPAGMIRWGDSTHMYAVKYPLLYRHHSAASTGAIVIETAIPHAQNIMVRARISGRHYSTLGSFDVVVQWYGYGPSMSFPNSYVQHLGPWRPAVQLGTNAAGNVVIILGTVGQSLGYPQVYVEEVEGYGSLAYYSGWTVSRPTVDLTAYSNLTTVAEHGVTDWSAILNKPATFAPSAHTHPISEVTGRAALTAGNGLTGTAYDGDTASTFAVASHAGTAGSVGTLTITADSVGVTLGTTATTAAAGNHTHAGVYAPVSHTHDWADITGEPTTLAGYGITDAADLASNTFTGAQVISADAAPLLTLSRTTANNAVIQAGNTTVTRYFGVNPSGEFGFGSVANLASSEFRVTGAGVVTTGTWQGTAIASAYIGSHTHLWADITDKPATFTPSAHVHSAADITTGTLAVARGGTGLATYTGAGRIIYSTAATTLAALAPGTNGHVLTLVGGLPAWASGAGGGAHTHAASDITPGTFGAGAYTFPSGSSVAITTGQPVLNLQGDAGNYSFLGLHTGTTARWYVARSNEAEGGANTGSNFAIYRYSDAGAYLGAPLVISRASGLVTIETEITAPYHSWSGGGLQPSVTFGSGRMTGSRSGWAGIEFSDSSGPMTLMVNTNGTEWGMYRVGVGWYWQVTNGVLTTGTVPATQISAGSFGVGSFKVTGSMNLEAGAGYAFGFWNSPSDYSIRMSPSNDVTHGGRLDSTSDYNMYFTMSGAGLNRGFVFRDGSTPVAQIEASGLFRTKGGIIIEDGTDVIYLNSTGTTYLGHQSDSGAWGAMRVGGITNGWAGFDFESVGAYFLVNGNSHGQWTGAAWIWHVDNGVLSSGSVPWARLTGVPEIVLGKVTDQSITVAGFTDITELTFPVEGSPGTPKHYLIEAFIVYETNTSAMGVQFGFNGPSFARMVLLGRKQTGATGTDLFTETNMGAYNTAYPASTAEPVGNQPLIWHVKGTAAFTANGTFAFRFTKENVVGTATVRSGSWVRYRALN